METTMGYGARQEYFQAQRKRYRQASRAQKGRILDEACALLGMHRKSVIRALGRAPGRRKRRGPKSRYGAPEILATLKVFWLKAQQPCGKRLQPIVKLWMQAYEQRYGALEPQIRQALLAMSPSTMDRLLASLRARRRKGLSATRSAQRLKGQIPIRTSFHDVEGPGWLEADTVAHCGATLAGAFVWSLTLTDIWSGWTVNRAVWNRSHKAIAAHLAEIEPGLEFDIQGFDCDNGSEFLNRELYRYFHDRPVPVEFTRSRAYRKNDNAHVEQKQWTHVRQLLGYERLENRRLLPLINDLYRGPWHDLQNFFLPTMKLVSKTREGSRILRRHTRPMTPCQRLLACRQVSKEAKDRLRRKLQSLDPFDLAERVEDHLKAIFRIVKRQFTRVLGPTKVA